MTAIPPEPLIARLTQEMDSKSSSSPPHLLPLQRADVWSWKITREFLIATTDEGNILSRLPKAGNLLNIILDDVVRSYELEVPAIISECSVPLKMLYCLLRHTAAICTKARRRAH